MGKREWERENGNELKWDREWEWHWTEIEDGNETGNKNETDGGKKNIN